MMDDPKSALILDISSDDEEVSGESNGIGGGYDCDWLMGLLDDDKEPAADSDDVVVVGEVILNPKQTVKSSTMSKDSLKAVDDDEDGDCVVLEEDPDKPVAIDDDDERDDDSDDLQIVSQKGQVACRDYPHTRYDCAKFPFASTPHESYCDQCHCYVCDSPAPCGYWGNGLSSTDHCHAIDKDEFWKTQRQNTKKNKGLSSVPGVVGAALSAQPPSVNQSPLPQLVSCNMTQNQAFSQGLIRPCSMSGSPGMPNINIIRQQRSQLPGFVVPSRLPGYIVPRSKFRDHLVYQQFRHANGNGNGISTARRQNAYQVGPHPYHSRIAFKRTGSVMQSSRNEWATPVTNANSVVSSQSQPSVQPCLESEFVNYLPSGPQIFSQSQTNAADSVLSESQAFYPSPNYVNPMSSQPRFPYQPGLGRTFTEYYSSEIHCSTQNVNGVWENSVLSESQTVFQPYVDSNSLDTTPSSEHLSGVNNFENPIHPRSELAYLAKGPFYKNQAQSSFQPNGGKGIEATTDCQLESSALPISLDESQNICHPANQTQNASEPGIACLGFSPHNVASADNSLLAPYPDDHLPDNSFPNALDFHFDNWIIDDSTVPRVIEVSVPPGLNAYSPEPASVDSWNLFQYS